MAEFSELAIGEDTYNDIRKMDKIGGTFTGQAKGITPVAPEDLTRMDYVDGAVQAEEDRAVLAEGTKITGTMTWDGSTLAITLP